MRIKLILSLFNGVSFSAVFFSIAMFISQDRTSSVKFAVAAGVLSAVLLFIFLTIYEKALDKQK